MLVILACNLADECIIPMQVCHNKTRSFFGTTEIRKGKKDFYNLSFYK